MMLLVLQLTCFLVAYSLLVTRLVIRPVVLILGQYLQLLLVQEALEDVRLSPLACWLVPVAVGSGSGVNFAPPHLDFQGVHMLVPVF